MRLAPRSLAPVLLLASAACAERITAAAPAATRPAPIVDALSGKVPQLAVVPASTAGARIRICQYSGMVPERAPLYVVDGRVIAHNDIHALDIAPDRIESIYIVKGAEAVARFGPTGVNGAVLVTLKH
ncbi:MAG TPA: TonB-dependent receptor plug domain-containing protein [Longimicrobiaceae bacterium]